MICRRPVSVLLYTEFKKKHPGRRWSNALSKSILIKRRWQGYQMNLPNMLSDRRYSRAEASTEPDLADKRLSVLRTTPDAAVASHADARKRILSLQRRTRLDW